MLFALLATFARADPPTRIEDYDLESLLGRVTAVTRRSQRRHEAPASVTVLDRRQIRASGARSVPELLRQVPGVRVLRNAPGNWVLSLRGVGEVVGNEILVLIDGQQMNHVLDMSVDWSLLPVSIEQIERIEVVRGPVSTTYGANAYTGVVNIVTVQRAAAGIFLGSDDHRERAGEIDLGVARHGQRFTWSAIGVARMDRLMRDSDVIEDTWGIPAHHRVRGAGGIVTGIGHLAEGVTLTARAQFAASQRTATDHLALPPRLLRSGQAAGSVRLRVGDPVKDRVATSAWARFGQYAAITDDPVPGSFAYTKLVDAAADAGVEVHAAPGDTVNVTLGTTARWWRVSFAHLDVERPTLRGLGGWATIEWRPTPHWTLSTGQRVDISSQLRAPAASPRLTLVHHHDHWSVRVSGAIAYREPTLLELDARFVPASGEPPIFEGNHDLLAPRLDTIELGGVLASTRLQLMPTFYVQRVRDSIHRAWSDAGASTYVNHHEPHTKFGGELEGAGTAGPVELSMSASARFPLEDVHEEQDVSIATLQPDLGLSGGASVLLGDSWEIGGRVVWTSSRDYHLQLGVPVIASEVAIPARARTSLTVDWLAPISIPLHVVATVVAPFPGGPDSVHDWGANVGPRLWLGLRWGAR